MPLRHRLIATLLPLTLAAAGLLAPATAFAQDRCEGTLCDLYYGNSGKAQPAQPAQQQAPQGATPMTVPSGGILSFFTGNRTAAPAAGTTAPGTAAAPARAPLVQMQGGGLINAAKGGPSDRCEGTLCDLYYGGPKPEKPEQPAVAPAPAAQSVEAEPDMAPRPTRVRRSAEPTMPAEKPRCAATGGDPWKCYR